MEKDKYIRLYADFDNYKKRCEKEKQDIIKNANEDIIIKLLTTLDDLERGINIDKDNGGMLLIYNNLLNILKQYGLTEIQVYKGDSFNSDYHHAISTSKSKDKNKIVDVLQKGYMMGNKVIRHTMVVIGN